VSKTEEPRKLTDQELQQKAEEGARKIVEAVKHGKEATKKAIREVYGLEDKDQEQASARDPRR
jgi:pyridoxal biosynthesis lyase PdxS